jgi:citrate lyase subunit beta/citryl-CoA lyase
MSRTGSPLRTWLLVPALKAERMLPTAFASMADCVILDLEAATPPADRERARALLGDIRREPATKALIFWRVNDAASADRDAEIDAAIAWRADGIVLPRVTSAAEVRLVADRLSRSSLAIVPMLETAAGLFDARGIAQASDRTIAMALGGEDLAADLGATRTPDGAELQLARGFVLMAAAAARCASVDTPWLDLSDPDGAGREAARAQLLGFTGKFVIHPAQVGPVHRAYVPSKDELERARAIVDLYEAGLRAGTGITVHDGRMIDEPIARNAQRVLARAQS